MAIDHSVGRPQTNLRNILRDLILQRGGEGHGMRMSPSVACDLYQPGITKYSQTQLFNFFITKMFLHPKRDEVTGEWRKLHNEELSDLYSLPNIVRVVKSRRMYGGGERCAQGSGSET
jgi:hypothetical protein